MKRRILIILALLVLFGQWANLEHAYHEHTHGEICEYCLSAQPFDHAAVDSANTFTLAAVAHLPETGYIESTPRLNIRYFSSRAPPRSIQTI